MRSRALALGLLVSLAGLVLSGCEGGPSELSSHWEKSGATKQDRRADINFCVKDTMEKAAGVAAVKRQAIYNQCMLSRGWAFRE